MNVAVIPINCQEDYVRGAMASPGAEMVLPAINRLIRDFESRGIIITAQDWHPLHHTHFNDHPVHCIQNSKGAELVPELILPADAEYSYKGCDLKDDGVSSFNGLVGHDPDRPLYRELEDLGVETIYLCGYDVCATAIEGRARGYNVYVVTNGTAGQFNEDERFRLLGAGVHFAEIH